jgi:predicted transcriptional regulator
MPYITARLSDQLIAELDRMAGEMRRARSDLVREAVERYLESVKDVQAAIERAEGQAEGQEERVVEWDTLRRHLGR